MSGQVFLRILDTKGLWDPVLNRDKKGTTFTHGHLPSDPYVAIAVKASGKSKSVGKVSSTPHGATDNPSPFFNEEFTLTVPGLDATLTLKLFVSRVYEVTHNKGKTHIEGQSAWVYFASFAGREAWGVV